jgi:hypothetical protein
VLFIFFEWQASDAGNRSSIHLKNVASAGFIGAAKA